MQRPVALGCTLMAAAVLFVGFIGFLGIKFLESGSNSGEVVLEDARAYGPGTVERPEGHNFYLVRMRDGEYFALDDLDAANRANPGRRCRVAPIPTNDPTLPALVNQYAPVFSPKAAGSTLIFREDCNGALYDATGVRLDAEGPNLDRFGLDINPEGKLVVLTAKRICSQRSAADAYAPAKCP